MPVLPYLLSFAAGAMLYVVVEELIPAFLVSLYFFGLGALIVTATSVAACLFLSLIHIYSKQRGACRSDEKPDPILCEE